jgi:hypothetical protein
MRKGMDGSRVGWMGQDFDGWAKIKMDGLGLGQVLVDGPG